MAAAAVLKKLTKILLKMRAAPFFLKQQQQHCQKKRFHMKITQYGVFKVFVGDIPALVMLGDLLERQVSSSALQCVQF
jgi:hypothetical protein